MQSPHSLPAAVSPQSPQHRQSRNDGVSPSLPKSPQRVPPPVSPPHLWGRGGGETPGHLLQCPPEPRATPTAFRTSSDPFAREERKS